jgi:hypothetical protein
VPDFGKMWAAHGAEMITRFQPTDGIVIDPAAWTADERAIMYRAIINSLAYVSVAIYLVYILIEGWNRLTPFF